MTTKIAVASFESPRRGYNFIMDTEQEESATYHQKRALADLIFCHIEDGKKREGYLRQLEDITKTEAADWMLEFTLGKCR